MNIRKPTPNDREAYIKLAEQFYSSEAVLHSVDRSCFENTFDEFIASDRYVECFLFEVDDSIAGYALITKTFTQEVGGLVYWIDELFILPQFRGRGIGHRFFEYILSLSGPKRFRLEVTAKNEGAIRLYRSLGFTPLDYSQFVKDV